MLHCLCSHVKSKLTDVLVGTLAIRDLRCRRESNCEFRTGLNESHFLSSGDLTICKLRVLSNKVEHIQSRAVLFITERVEKVITKWIGQVLAYKKKFPQLVEEFANRLNGLHAHIPHIPKNIPGIDLMEDGLRNRAERLEDQVRALPLLAQACLFACDKPGVTAPWPSTIKSAKQSLLARPLTKIGHAMEEYAGARLLMQKVETIQQPSATDEHSNRVIEKVKLAVASSSLSGAMPPMETYMVHVSKLQSSVVSLTEELPKLSLSAYESTADSLKLMLDQMVDTLSQGEHVLWARMSQDIEPGMSALNLTFTDPGEVQTELSENQVVMLKEISRQSQYLLGNMPNWNQTLSNALASCVRFMQTVMKDVARDTYSTFASIETTFVELQASLQLSIGSIKMIFEGLQAVTRLCLSEDKHRPINDLLKEWSVWNTDSTQSSDKVPFIESLLTVGRTRSNLVKGTFKLPVAETLRLVFVQGALTKQVLRTYIDMNVGAALKAVASSVQNDQLGNIEAEAWNPTALDGVLTIKGLLNGSDEEIKELGKTIKGHVDFEADHIATRNFVPAKNFELVELFVQTFGLETLKVDQFNQGSGCELEVAFPHLRVRVRMAAIVCFIIHIHGQAVADNENVSILKKEENKKADPWVFNYSLVRMLLAAEVETTHLRDMLQTDTFSSSSNAVQASTDISILKVRNFTKLAFKFLDKVKSTMTDLAMESMQPTLAHLKASCPQFTTWATDDDFDLDELKKFVKTVNAEKVKTLVRENHYGLALVISLCSKWSVDTSTGTTLSNKISDAKSSIQFGKNCLAMRTGGLVLITEGDIDPAEVRRKIEAIEKLNVQLPKSILKAMTNKR